MQQQRQFFFFSSSLLSPTFIIIHRVPAGFLHRKPVEILHYHVIVRPLQISTMTAVIQPSAYAKVILHAAKYPSSPIGGYVIGQGEDEKMTISDVIPMCHSNPCGPMFEIAAEMVRIMSKMTLSCTISRLTFVHFFICCSWKNFSAILHRRLLDITMRTKMLLPHDYLISTNLSKVFAPTQVCRTDTSYSHLIQTLL